MEFYIPQYISLIMSLYYQIHQQSLSCLKFKDSPKENFLIFTHFFRKSLFHNQNKKSNKLKLIKFTIATISKDNHCFTKNGYCLPVEKKEYLPVAHPTNVCTRCDDNRP